MKPKTAQVDGYIRKNARWREALAALRAIVLDRGLVEEIKWRTPCYTLDGKTVVMLGAFSEGVVLSFLKGAMLKDPKQLLVKPGENTQAARVIRFTSADEVTKREKVLKAYVDEAIALEREGKTFQFKKVSEFAVPEELQARLDADDALKKAFAALTPGRQRGYLLHIAGAKQSATRASRVDKCALLILAGKGLDDEYRAKMKRS